MRKKVRSHSNSEKIIILTKGSDISLFLKSSLIRKTGLFISLKSSLLHADYSRNLSSPSSFEECMELAGGNPIQFLSFDIDPDAVEI